MSMPTNDYNQQLLGFLQTWRQLLEQWGALTAGAAFPNASSVMPTISAGGQFMPPGMPSNPASMPPTAPLAPPSPADYTQQLFGYLQAWRQYLEQMAGPRPASSQPSTASPPTSTPPPTSNASTGSAALPPVVNKPPADETGTAGAGGVSNFGKSAASNSALVPPFVEAKAPANQGGSQIDSMSVDHAAGLRHTPNPPGPFGGPEPPAVFRPPIYDYGNFIDRRQYRSEAASATGAPAPSQRRSPAAAPAERAVASPFRGVMGRVTPDASPPVKPQTLFKNAGQTPSP